MSIFKLNIRSLNDRGFGIIEAIVGVSIATILLVAFVSLTLQSIKTSRFNDQHLQAALYCQELIEITKDLEQSNFNAFDACLPDCHAKISSGVWTLETGTPTDDSFYTRWLTVEDIVHGELPDDTKKITATVSWNSGTQSTVLETYIYDTF